MKTTNIQLTIVIPQEVKYEWDLMKLLPNNRYIKQLVREGRQLTSWGFTRREKHETEVIVNYE